VAVVLPLMPPVVPVVLLVELFGVVEFDWSVEVCGVVVLMPELELPEFGVVELSLVPVVELV